ncbi:MAG: LacI family DNA-binding transcriptional regulator, partial [Burkholderiaceae bacterium]|nr:LacI family DNA-binding transcriptional regulator [Burkholderiaceae bacterium]
MNTIQDVARQAEVSVSTVSNVLNGRTDRMRKETLQRVEAAIAALSFRPNSVARRLKTGDTPLVGLLVPSLANPMYGSIAREVETFAQGRYNHRVLIGSTYRDRHKEAAFFEDLLAHGVRRVIVISSLADERHFETAVERGMVVVSYDRRAARGRASRVEHVTPDNFEAARLATAHLIAHGHTKLAFATVAGMTMSRSAKIQGFQAAASASRLQDHAVVLDGGPVDEYGDSMISEVGRALAQRLAADPARPTGIVAVNDLMALGLMAGLREAGVRVPQEVSVVGIDGLFLAALSNPGLSTVQLPITEMARTMVDYACGPRAGASREEVFTPELVQRESV